MRDTEKSAGALGILVGGVIAMVVMTSMNYTPPLDDTKTNQSTSCERSIDE